MIGDNIPNLYHNVSKLYLSNNNIETLTGIEVFTSLTHLSISYNHLPNFEELLKIQNPLLIVNLSVKGNFFCKNPYTNLQIVKRFKK